MLRRRSSVGQLAGEAISHFESQVEDPGNAFYGVSYVRLLDDLNCDGWKAVLQIYMTLFSRPSTNLSVESVQEFLRNHESNLALLESANGMIRPARNFDGTVSRVQLSVQEATHKLICELPGVEFDGHRPESLPFNVACELFNDSRLQFILPGRCSEGFFSISPRLKDFLEGVNPEQLPELIADLRAFPELGFCRVEHAMQRQLWRCHDLRDGGGFGFTVENFLLAVKQLLSTSPSSESQSALYVSTFRVITSDWTTYRHSVWTIRILLDIIASRGGLMARFNYPSYITDELLALVANMLRGQTGLGPYIDLAEAQLNELRPQFYEGPEDFPARALEVIVQSRQSATSSSP
jgi:hypothetical protein